MGICEAKPEFFHGVVREAAVIEAPVGYDHRRRTGPPRLSGRPEMPVGDGDKIEKLLRTLSPFQAEPPQEDELTLCTPTKPKGQAQPLFRLTPTPGDQRSTPNFGGDDSPPDWPRSKLARIFPQNLDKENAPANSQIPYMPDISRQGDPICPPRAGQCCMSTTESSCFGIPALQRDPLANLDVADHLVIEDVLDPQFRYTPRTGPQMLPRARMR
mmetsp:Transcript_21357/g.51804  ORF Transcript_21357/g.51804 Transcript_21357/m.51804 type:complete len:214 (+) Transcript_21357:25-666(+)